jgi:hypothetical protein
MQGIVGVGKRTYAHTAGTVGSGSGPVSEAGLLIDLPPQHTINLISGTKWNGFGRTVFCTFFANSAKIDHGKFLFSAIGY